MIDVKRSLKLLKKYDRKWWEVLPVREDVSLLLSQDKNFWKSLGHKFGWIYHKTPYESSKDELLQNITDWDKISWFYEKSGIFTPPLHRSKLGSWCFWIGLKYLKKE